MVHTKKILKKTSIAMMEEGYTDPNGKRHAESREIHAQASDGPFLL